MNTQSTFSVLVDVHPHGLEAHIRDARSDALALFSPLDDGQREGLVTDAWRVGLRTIMSAYKHAEESRLHDIGASLKKDIDEKLGVVVERQQAAFVEVLARYFNPRDGEVVARLEGFLRDDGALSKTMDRFLAPEHGSLAKTLAREVGEHSPLLRRLSPTDSEGVLFLLETKLREALKANQVEVARALDPVSQDGAIGRFLRALRLELEKADNDRTKQLALATKALDANDETSLLSRLMRETAAARTAFVSAMNPELPDSPMSVLKSALSTLLGEHAKSQEESMLALHERQTKLDQDIRSSLARLEERKRGAAKSPRGGFDFEEVVLGFVQRAVLGGALVADSTGGTVGAKPGCKVGDQLLKFTSESIYAGSSVVIEAKHESGYTVSKALAQLELARGNRLAPCGLFVLARSVAPVAFPTLARFGNDVVVVWDEEDDATAPYLHAAITLSLALASRQRKPDDAGDIKALQDIEHRIFKEVERLDKMRKLSESIRKDADALGEEIRKGGDALGRLLKNAKSTLLALNVELADAEGAREFPVMLPADSLARASAPMLTMGESVDASSADMLKSA